MMETAAATARLSPEMTKETTMNRPRLSLSGGRAPRAALGAGAALAAALALAARPAAAQTVDCSTLPNPIYGDGGTAAQPYIGKLATELAKLSTPVTVLFKGTGGCTGIYGMLTPTSLTGTFSYWDTTGARKSCTQTTPVLQQWGNQVNSHHLCVDAPDTLPSTIGDFNGPVTPVNFVTALQSKEVSISAEAAYYVFGFGGQSTTAAYNIAPWTNPTYIVRRDQNSAVGLYAGLAIGVGPNSQKGTLATSNNDTLAKVFAAGTAGVPDAGLGYVSSDVADGARTASTSVTTPVKTLAYQHKGQICGYLPDATSTSFDKKNVRDGHYWIWGPQHFFAPVDATGQVTDPNVAKLIGLNAGTFTIPNVDAQKLAVQTSNIPQCAMQVWRDGDLGELYSYAPPAPCTCFFEANVSGGSTSCKSCANDGDCASVSAASKCRKSYCEVY
jgi:hypothetical protein